LQLPARPGDYVLFLSLQDDRSLIIGRLGRFFFPAGIYAYVGSARGPGGLAARLARHMRHPKSLHWHVDTLRTASRPVAVWFAVQEQERECAWAAVLARMPGASLPAPRFGASDCRCPAHLIHFPTLPDLPSFAAAAGEENLQLTWVAPRGLAAHATS
jgi:Uri superfamily endonuclease